MHQLRSQTSSNATMQIADKQRIISRMIQGALALVLLALSGCDHQNYLIPRDSHTLSNRFYTFAIYNDAGRLLTHPLLDLERTLNGLKTANPDTLKNSSVDDSRCSKITDIYVMSHGWNYSAGEAVANYHNYIELLDRLGDKAHHADSKSSGEFCPYLILVTWTSTTRSVEELTSGILPFNLGEVLRPVGAITDTVLLHPLTAWKQSFRAGAIALGTHYANSYLYRPWYTTDSDKFGTQYVKEYGTESPYFLDSDTGYDAPLSAMIYEIIKWKTDPKPAGPSLKETAIHLVGHSYGAKLVALAGMEALRRWVLVDHMLDNHFGDTESEKLHKLEEVINGKSSDNEIRQHWHSTLTETGHGWGLLNFPSPWPIELIPLHADTCSPVEIADYSGPLCQDTHASSLRG